MAFDECNTELDFIPKGYTCKLQAMDVGINKPFKNHTTHQFDEWLVANMDKKPKRSDVAWWIWNAWNHLSEGIIRNSWRGCGISLDGTSIVSAEEMVDCSLTEDDGTDSDDELLNDRDFLGLTEDQYY